MGIMSYLISIFVFAAAISIKGGWLGHVFHNWNRLVKRIEAAFEDVLETVVNGFESKNYTDKALWVALFKLPFHGFAKWFMDGSIISVFLVLFYAGATLEAGSAVIFTLGYALVLVSMGEEAGSVGDYKGGWGDYLTAKNPDGSKAFGRTYGIKKAAQYGAYSGAVMAMAAGSWTLWFSGILFPLFYFIGNSASLYFTGRRGWAYSEPLWGAAIGLAYELARNGFLMI